MARNSCTLNIQDFIPYPVNIRPIKDFISEDPHQPPNKNTTTTKTSPRAFSSSCTECPFDCCQKNLQSIFFPRSKLANATFRMKISSAETNGSNKMSEIPCLEKRTIYEGIVTDSPVQFEELIKKDKVVLADPGTLRLTFHQGQVQDLNENKSNSNNNNNNKQKITSTKALGRDQQYVWDSERSAWVIPGVNEASDSLRSRLRHDWRAYNNSLQSKSDEWNMYQGDGVNFRNTRQLWTHDVESDEVKIGRVINDSAEKLQYQQQQQYYQYLRSKLSLTSVTLPNADAESSQTSVITSAPRSFNQSQASETLAMDKEDDLLKKQLSAHLKSFKYIKQSPMPYNIPNTNVPSGLNLNANTNVNIRSGYPSHMQQSASFSEVPHPQGNINYPKGLHLNLNPLSKSFKHKGLLLDGKRELSPKEALEQYEMLKKYWDYRHKLLANGVFDSNNTSGIGAAASTAKGISYTPASASASTSAATLTPTQAYNYSHSAAKWPTYGPATVTATKNQNYQAALSYWNSSAHPYQRQLSTSRAESAPAYNQDGSRGVVKFAKERKLAPAPSYNSSASANSSPQQPALNLDYHQQQWRNMSKISNLKRPISRTAVMGRNEMIITYQQRNDNSEIQVPINDININTNVKNQSAAVQTAGVERAGVSVTTPTKEMDVEDSPKDLTISKRQSDLSAAPSAEGSPERSKSTELINNTYDHIVLLDKRVKTYMCKRCFEPLKSEQEIRNHLFCKMLSDTVQCHVCRCLFKAEDYPDHLKAHAIKAI